MKCWCYFAEHRTEKKNVWVVSNLGFVPQNGNLFLAVFRERSRITIRISATLSCCIMVLITSCLLFSCWPAAWRIFGTRKIWMVSRRTTCRTKKRAGVTPAGKKNHGSYSTEAVGGADDVGVRRLDARIAAQNSGNPVVLRVHGTPTKCAPPKSPVGRFKRMTN